MKVLFSKMEGLGNDFMVIDAMQQPLPLDTATVQRLADRRTGIGFDQLLVIGKPKNPAHAAVSASTTPTAARWSSAATARAA